MADALNLPTPCMRIANSQLKLEQVQTAMRAMMAEVQATSTTPVCMAIVDASGNLEAFQDGRSPGVYAAACRPQGVHGGGGIEYDPQPPYDAGAPSKAGADVVAYARETVQDIVRKSLSV